MAVQVETRGQLQEFLDTLRRRSWQVILPAAFLIAVGTSVAVIIPKKYAVKTQVEMRPVGISVSTKEGGNAPFQIRARERVKKVVQALKNERYLSLTPDKQFQFLLDIQNNIKVTLAKGAEAGTNFVNIEYADVDAQWAKEFLAALRDDWTNDVLDRDRNKIEDEKNRLQDEKTNLLREYDHEEAAVTEIKKANNISATQPIPGALGARNEDPIYTQRTENKKELDKASLALVKLEKKLEVNRKRYDEMPPRLKKEQVVGGQTNAGELNKLELEYVETQSKLREYRPEHHKYRELREKMDEIEDKREQLQKAITKGELRSEDVPNPERTALKKLIDADNLEAETLRATKTKLQEDVERDDGNINELQEVYRDLRERQEKLARLTTSLADTERHLTEKVQQAKLMQSPLANPFMITEEVQTPTNPTEPNPWLIIAFAVMAGFASGLGLATVLEFSKNCFRNVHDISRVMVIPVLGSINTIVTRRQLRLRSAKRVAVGLSSLVVIGSVVFVTWAWASAPELLSPGLREKIELVRSKFH
jgi:capsular polysaccharide biosynthesis protein